MATSSTSKASRAQQRRQAESVRRQNRLRARQEARSEAQSQPVKARLKPAHEIFNRIRHDSSIDRGTVIIGFIDRFDGLMEVPFNEFDLESIPFHRVRFFRLEQVPAMLWERESRTDNITGRNFADVVAEMIAAPAAAQPLDASDAAANAAEEREEEILEDDDRYGYD